MPISQDRMMVLIEAARDYQQALQTICDFIAQQGSKVIAGAEPISVLNEIYTFANEKMLLARPDSPFVIGQEFQHFRRAAKRNERVRAKQDEKRRDRGVPLAKFNTAPRSILDGGKPPRPNMIVRQSLVVQRTEYMHSAAAAPPSDAEALIEQIAGKPRPEVTSRADREVERLLAKADAEDAAEEERQWRLAEQAGEEYEPGREIEGEFDLGQGPEGRDERSALE